MSSLSPDEYRNTLDARLKLIELNRWERVAELSESDPVSFMRTHHADAYRRHFGFPPSLRSDVRNTLDNLHRTGSTTVNEALAKYQASGFSDASADSNESSGSGGAIP